MNRNRIPNWLRFPLSERNTEAQVVEAAGSIFASRARILARDVSGPISPPEPCWSR